MLRIRSSLAFSFIVIIRKKIEINSDAKQKYIEDYVISLDEIKKYTKDKGIKKIIYIKEKLVNIVTE